MGDDAFEAVADLAQRGHRGDDLVAEIFRVLFRVVAAVVLEQFLQVIVAYLGFVGQPAEIIEGALRLLGAGAGGFDGRDAPGELALVAIGGRQDEAVGHQRHELRLDVDRLVVLLQRDVVTGAHFALVEHAVLLERLDHLGLDRFGIRVN